MIDEHDLFDRAIGRFPPPSGSFDRLVRRRDRKRRNRRITAAVLAFGIFVAMVAYLGASIHGRTSEPATPAPLPIGWFDVTLADPFYLNAVAAADAGFVAVGERDQPVEGGTWDPVLFSPDGRSWSPVTCAGSAILSDVISGGPGFIAVGMDGTGADFGAFYSSDGRTWTQAEVARPRGAGGTDRDNRMYGVAPTEAGFVAWGRALDGPAYVWTSADGVAWRPIPDESVFVGAGETFIMWIGQGADGLVAGGYTRPSGSSARGDAVAWTSSDGVTWLPIPSMTWAKLRERRSSVTVRDRRTANGSTGSVKISDASIRFRAGGSSAASVASS